MEWLGLSIFAWITLGVIIMKLGLSIHSRLPGDIVALMIIGIFIVTGTLSAKDALDCFAQDGLWVVILLLIVVYGLVQNGVIDYIVNHFMSESPTYTRALNELMVPVAFLSAFLSSRTVIAIFMKVVEGWCHKTKIRPSKLLIPLSYAAGLGGVCTLIGTAPNLLVAYFYQERTGEGMNFFAPFLPGLVCAIVGILAVNFLKRLLPERKSATETFENSDKYTVELLVPSECDVVGQTIEEAELDNVDGGHLIEIVNFDKEVVSPVPKDTFVMGGDRLVYTGFIKDILTLREKKGLVNATHHVFSVNEMGNDNQRHFQMVSVLSDSSLIGTRMVDNDFEEQNDVVLVAIARDGERLEELPREVEIRNRDVLLLEGAKMNPDNFMYQLMFLDNATLPVSKKQTLTVSLILLGMVLLSNFEVLPLLTCTILAIALMALFRCITPKQIQQSLNWKLLCTYAGSVCIGTAINETGLAQSLANDIINLCGNNPVGSLCIICTTATIITEFISNTAAAAIFAPVGWQIAHALNANPMTFMIAIMIGVSSSYANPSSCEGHALISGPGGYRFSDFARIGIPMNIIMLVATIISCLIFYPI